MYPRDIESGSKFVVFVTMATTVDSINLGKNKRNLVTAVLPYSLLIFCIQDFEFAEITLPEHEAHLRNIDLRIERNRL